jgi:hypothetical protein
MAAGRPTRRRASHPRPLTERQVYRRLQAALDEIAALGGAYQLTAGEIRRRLLLLERQLREALERWPPD